MLVPKDIQQVRWVGEKKKSKPSKVEAENDKTKKLSQMVIKVGSETLASERDHRIYRKMYARNMKRFGIYDENVQ